MHGPAIIEAPHLACLQPATHYESRIPGKRGKVPVRAIENTHLGGRQIEGRAKPVREPDFTHLAARVEANNRCIAAIVALRRLVPELYRVLAQQAKVFGGRGSQSRCNRESVHEGTFSAGGV